MASLLGPQPIIASYTSSPIPHYRGNPFIEALPPIKDDIEWLDQLMELPPTNPVELDDPAYIRGYHVPKLKDVFVPATRHRVAARRIDILIRQGYISRNPLDPDRHKMLQTSYENMQQSGKAGKIVFDPAKPISSYSILGMSGMGKTTFVEAALGAYPQYVSHPQYGLHQIVWMKLDCPKNGDTGELVSNGLRKFDRILGTSHSKCAASTKPYTLTQKFNHLANVHGLGVLVLDEIQNLSIKKSGGREEMLNWFQELVNDLRLPVILLGTFKAKSVLNLDVRHTRRQAVLGSGVWDRMQRDDEFEQLLETIWEYQWLRDPGDLTDELKETIYRHTQGVTAFVIDMLVIAQLRALRQGVERLTPKIFDAIADEEFAALQAFIKAMRSNDPIRLKKFEDAMSYDIEERIAAAQRLIPQSVPEPTRSKGSVLEDAVRDLVNFTGISDIEAKELLQQVWSDKLKSRGLVQAAIKEYFARHGRVSEGTGSEKPST